MVREHWFEKSGIYDIGLILKNTLSMHKPFFLILLLTL